MFSSTYTSLIRIWQFAWQTDKPKSLAETVNNSPIFGDTMVSKSDNATRKRFYGRVLRVKWARADKKTNDESCRWARHSIFFLHNLRSQSHVSALFCWVRQLAPLFQKFILKWSSHIQATAPVPILLSGAICTQSWQKWGEHPLTAVLARQPAHPHVESSVQPLNGFASWRLSELKNTPTLA